MTSFCLYFGSMSKMPFPRMLYCLKASVLLAEGVTSSGFCSRWKLSQEGMLLSSIQVPMTGSMGIFRSLSIYISIASFMLRQGNVKIIYSQSRIIILKIFILILSSNAFQLFNQILISKSLLVNVRFCVNLLHLQSFNYQLSLSFAMSMRKTSIVIPEQTQSPREKPNQKAFQRWLHRNNFQHETPVLIQNSFKNLEKPLQFIRDQKIKNLEVKSENLIDNLHLQKEAIAEMSKSTYKKVISRDRVDYQFGSSSLQDKSWYRSHYQDSHKTEAKKKDDNTKILQKRGELTKEFIHNQHQYDIQQKNEKRQLTLEIIKQIDSKDFDQKYKDVQFYEVFIRDDYEKHISNFADISENYEMDELLNRIRFTLIDRDSYYSPKSVQYLFKAEQELDFWRRYSNEAQEINNADQIQIMKRCQNFNPKEPSFMQLLDFASGKLDSQIISSYFQLKSKQEAEIKINQNDENLEDEYNKKKQQYDFLRSMKMKDKSQKIAIKYNKNTTQTNDILQDQSFDSYFEQSVKSLLIRLEDLNKIRDTVMEKRENEATKKTMLVNIGHDIKNILFRLLAFTLQGEVFVNYEEIIATTDENLVEKKILEIIYHDFHRMKLLEVDGIAKTKILDTYLEEREKNQKMFELLGRIYNQQKPSVQKKGKSPVPKKTKNQKK